MPTYIYKCINDGPFEVVLKMDDVTSDYPCPECGLRAKRLYTSPPVVYNSDGFYTTDRKGIKNKGGGDKQQRLREYYEYHHPNEKAPPPAADVPKSGGEKY